MKNISIIFTFVLLAGIAYTGPVRALELDKEQVPNINYAIKEEIKSAQKIKTADEKCTELGDVLENSPENIPLIKNILKSITKAELTTNDICLRNMTLLLPTSSVNMEEQTDLFIKKLGGVDNLRVKFRYNPDNTFEGSLLAYWAFMSSQSEDHALNFANYLIEKGADINDEAILDGKKITVKEIIEKRGCDDAKKIINKENQF